MILKNTLTEKDFIHEAHQMLVQARSQSEIAFKLAAFGYTSEKIDEGLQITNYANLLLEQIEESRPTKNQWVKEYQHTKATLEKLYLQHRQKAKMIFRKSPDVLSMLGLTGSIPINFTEWFSTLLCFYSGVLASPVLQQRLLRFHLSLSEIKKGQQLLKLLETLHKNYLNEEEIPDPVIFERNELLITFDHWLDDFLIAAEFAFEKSPKLKKMLGISRFLHH